MKTDTEPKENNCTLIPKCFGEHGCAHNQHNGRCDYQVFGNCQSAVAQVNALTIRLQELTGKKVGLG